MLFNSYEFCLLFLPLCLIVYRAAGRYQGQTFAVAWLLLASIIFYAWSSTTTLVILGASILLNYGFARLLTSLRDHADPRRGWIAGIAVAANLAILAQYKYMEFLVEAGAAMMGIDMPLVRAIPPLAISFFTFQQIAYLVDVQAGDDLRRVVTEDLNEVAKILKDRPQSLPIDYLRVERLRTIGAPSSNRAR